MSANKSNDDFLFRNRKEREKDDISRVADPAGHSPDLDPAFKKQPGP